MSGSCAARHITTAMRGGWRASSTCRSWFRRCSRNGRLAGGIRCSTYYSLRVIPGFQDRTGSEKLYITTTMAYPSEWVYPLEYPAEQTSYPMAPLSEYRWACPSGWQYPSELPYRLVSP